MTEEAEPPRAQDGRRVYISYSQDSEGHGRRVRELADKLVREGVDCVLDQYETFPPLGWQEWMKRHLEEADFVLVVCSSGYYAKANEPRKSGVRFESVLMDETLYENGMWNNRILPVVFESLPTEQILPTLRPYHRFSLVSDAGYDELYRYLTSQPRFVKPELGQVRLLPPEQAAPVFVGVERLEALSRDLTADLSREQAEPLGLPYDPARLPLSDEDEMLAMVVRDPGGRAHSTLGELLRNEEVDRFVLLGEPGTGKTSILKQIALFEARRLAAGERGARLPVYVRLLNRQSGTTLEDLALEAVCGFAPGTDPGQLTGWLAQGRVRLLLDGLNEVPIEEYRSCQSEIDRLMRRFSRCGFVVTDRPSYDSALPAPAFRLKDWDFVQVTRYVQRATAQLGGKADPRALLERIKQHPDLERLVSSPLALGILTGTYNDGGEIAFNRGQLYRSFTKKLLERDRLSGTEAVPSAVKEGLLQSLALEMIRRGLNTLREGVALDILSERLLAKRQEGEVSGVAPHAALEELCRCRWLRRERRDDHLQFRYTAVQEYFAACELLERWTRSKPLSSFISDARFEESIVLLANLLGSDVDPLLREVSRIAGVHLAARCLIGMPAVAGRSRIIQQLARELSSNIELRRRSAAAKFIHLRAPEAVRPLVAALADESGAVRWNASMAIEKTLERSAADRLFIEILDGEQSDAIRRTACQALGRSPTLQAASALVRALNHSSEAVRLEAASSLARTSQPAAMRLLEAAARGGASGPIQAGALRALSMAAAEPALELARACYESPSPLVRSEAHLALGRLGDTDEVAAAIERTQQGHQQVRLRAIQDLEEMGEKAAAAAGPLWNLLAETELQPRVFAALRRIASHETLTLASRDLESADADRRRTAVKVLGHLGDPRALALLVRALSDPDENVGQTASEHFRSFGDRATPALQEALENALADGGKVRCRAVLQALQRVGTRMAVQLLVEVVEAASPVGAEVAFRCLDSCDPDQVRLILRERRANGGGADTGRLDELLQRCQLRHNLRLALDFRSTEDPEVWKELEEEAHSSQAALRLAACAGLCETRSALAEPILRQIAARDESCQVRARAIRSLVRLHPEPDASWISALAAWAGDPEQPHEVRRESLRALGAVGGGRERELLIEQARGSEPELAEAAALAVAEVEVRQRLGDAPRLDIADWQLDLLSVALKSRRSQERVYAVVELATMQKPHAMRLLLSAVRDGDPRVRETVADTLGRLRWERATGVLGELLQKDAGLAVRRSALIALREIGSAEAVSKICVAAADAYTALRELAIESLAPWASRPEAFRGLTRFLRDPDARLRGRATVALAGVASASFTAEHVSVIKLVLADEDPNVRRAILECLRAPPPPALLRHLLELARKDVEPAVRSAAVRALAGAPLERAGAVLAGALRDPDGHVRRESVRALASTAEPSAQAILRMAVRNSQELAEEVLSPTSKAGEASAAALLPCLLGHLSVEVRLRGVDFVEAQGPEAELGQLLAPVIANGRAPYREAQWRAIEVAGRLHVEAVAPLLARLMGVGYRPLYERVGAALQQIGTARVLPELLSHLESTNPHVVAAVVPLLGASGRGEAVAPLVSLLKRAEPVLCSAAIRALAQLGHSSAVERLASFARSTPFSGLREEVLAAFGNLQGQAATDTLLWAMDHAEKGSRDTAEEALVRSAPSLPVTDLLTLVGSTRPAARAVGASQLGRRRDAAAAGLLGRLAAQDPIPAVRAAAVEALGEIGTPEAVGALVPALRGGDPHLKRLAIEAVAAHPVPDPRVLGYLLRTIDGASPETEVLQHAAERALIATGSPKLPAELLARLSHTNHRARQSACRLLGELSMAEAVPRLVGLLDDDNPFTRQAAVSALRRIGAAEVADELLRAMRHPEDWRMRVTAVRAIGEMRVEEATADVGEMLRDEMWVVRKEAVLALAAIGTSQAIEMLSMAALDFKEEVRESALISLAGVPGDSSAAGAAANGLRLVLEDRTKARRLRALGALAKNPSPRSLDGLLQAVHNGDPDVREAAIRGLGHRNVGDHLEVLSDAAVDPNPRVQQAARRALESVRRALLDQVLNLARRSGWKYIYIWHESQKQARSLLEQAGPDWSARVLLDRLAHPNAPAGPPGEFSEACVRVLGWVAPAVTSVGLSHELAQAVLRSMSHKLQRMRIAALIAAGDAGLERALPAIQQAAAQGDTHEQQAAIRALVELNVDESAPTLRALSAPEQPRWTRSQAIRGFEEIEDFGARPEALKALEDKDVRWAAIVALGKIGTPEDVPRLLEYLDDEDPALRRAASISLRKLGGAAIANEFVALLRDPSASVVATAVRACRDLRLAEAVEALVDLALYGDPALCGPAAEALATLNALPTVAYLAPFAFGALRPETAAALAVLARLELPEAQETLASALANARSGVRLAGVRALGESPERRRHRSLVPQALRDVDSEVRRAALDMVGKLGLCPLFQPDVVGMLGDGNSAVRARAATVLGQSGEPSSVATLIAAAERETDDDAQTAVFEALARLATQEARAWLERRKEEGTPRQRFRVIAALQEERLREIREETTARLPGERLADPNPFIRSMAIRQIAEQGLVGEVPKLLPFLHDSNPFLCQAALDALGRLGERSVLGAVIGLIQSPNPWTRAKAAEALGRLADVNALGAITGLLRDPVSPVRRNAATALIAIDHPQAREIAQEVLRAGEADLASFLAEQLGVAVQQWTPTLLQGLDHEHDDVRLAVVRQLARRQSDPARLAGLRRALDRAQPQVVLRQALRTVAVTGTRELVAEVAWFLRHKDSFLRAEAARTLGTLRAQDQGPALIEALRDPEPHVVESAARALGEMRAAAGVPALAELLGHEARPVVLAAIQALASIDTAETNTVIGQALALPDPLVREQAIRALRSAPYDVALPYWLDAIHDDHVAVRHQAAESLGAKDRSEAISALSGALRDPNPFVRSAAACSLGRIASDPALVQLDKALEDSNSYVRVRAVQAIGGAADPNSYGRLLSGLEDADSYVRAAVVSALPRFEKTSWFAAVARLARLDPIIQVRNRARRALEAAIECGARPYLQELAREQEEEAAAMCTPQHHELADDLERYRRKRDSLGADERAPLLACLTEAFSSGLAPLRIAACRLLAYLPPGLDALAIYEHAVQDPQPAVRKAGVLALARLGGTESVRLLQRLIQSDESTEVRTGIVTAVADLREDEVVINILQSGLTDPNRVVVQEALAVLASRGIPCSAEIAKPLLGHSDDLVRRAAVHALARLGAADAVTEIRRLLADGNLYVRQEALRAIALLGGEQATLEACRRGLEDSNLSVQLTSVQVLSRIASVEAMPNLLEQIHHPQTTVRAAAVSGLRSFLSARAEGVCELRRQEIGETLLGRFAGEPDASVRREILVALSHWDQARTVRALQRHLFERNTPVRRELVRMCEGSPDDLDVEELTRQFLEAGEGLTVWVRRDLSGLVRGTNPERFFHLLVRMLADSDDLVRANAACSLGRTGRTAAIRELIPALSDSASMVRDIASRAVGRLRLAQVSPRPLSRAGPELPDAGSEDAGQTARLLALLDADGGPPSCASTKAKLASADWIDRWSATIFLADEPTVESAIILLKTSLEDASEVVRAEAKRMLAHLPRDVLVSASETLDAKMNGQQPDALAERFAELLAEIGG